MANSLFPAFVNIDYHSAFGAHSMTLPTKAYTGPDGLNPSGTFLAWDSSARDADDMINALVTLFIPFFKADTTFDSYTIYTMADPDASPQPQYAATLGNVGTSIQTAWSKAVQTTFSFRTDLFGQMKLVFLDAPSNNLFDKFSQFDTSPEAVAIRDELADSANAWSARDNGKPTVLVQIAYTLNEKLRREYGMN